jgi:c(7)-type cytochrome triheme protein
MPANRAKPEVLGKILLGRVADDSGNARGIDAGVLPRATFPHVPHRIRYRCKVCHLEIFEPKQGANRVTMRAIAAGEACGKCHNGTAAFAPSISNCATCHIGTEATAPAR